MARQRRRDARFARSRERRPSLCRSRSRVALGPVGRARRRSDSRTMRETGNDGARSCSRGAGCVPRRAWGHCRSCEGRNSDTAPPAEERKAVNQELGLRILADLLGWSNPRASAEYRWLRVMSSIKYDGYQDFAAGKRFIESLIVWLKQFRPGEDRKSVV